MCIREKLAAIQLYSSVKAININTFFLNLYILYFEQNNNLFMFVFFLRIFNKRLHPILTCCMFVFWQLITEILVFAV